MGSENQGKTDERTGPWDATGNISEQRGGKEHEEFKTLNEGQCGRGKERKLEK